MNKNQLPKEGDIIWNYGHEFIVRDPQIHKVPDKSGSCFSHQFTYKGECTANPCNDSIRHTGYNGGTYGYGVNVEPASTQAPKRFSNLFLDDFIKIC